MNPVECNAALGRMRLNALRFRPGPRSSARLGWVVLIVVLSATTVLAAIPPDLSAGLTPSPRAPLHSTVASARSPTAPGRSPTAVASHLPASEWRIPGQVPTGPGHIPLVGPNLWGTSRPNLSPAAGNVTLECLGLQPPAGQQSIYENGCYGHDEPGVDFYSNVPGSGGNVTWNVSLPVDGGSNQLQSALYAATWFGLPLSDSNSWLDQCYLELQFYPDTSWTLGPSPGNWVALAVAWQIDPVSGFEDPCFYAPMYLNGTPTDGFFNMNQGDQIQVVLSGWVGQTTGETISIDDLTTSSSSNATLIDPNGSVPIEPAYGQSLWPNALEWTPGGELPAAFAFEIGHSGDPTVPENNSYGGCSPGVPPPTPVDGAVPCPSYDPSSWSNDTAQPWEIQPPTFSNGSHRVAAVQGAFVDDLGGSAAVNSLSNGACLGRLGSAHCSYPWYSYACTLHAFEFGAVDYAGVSRNFGQYNEYATLNVSNGLGFPYYPPANFSVPSCSSPNGTLTVALSGAGSVVVSGTTVSTGATIPDLLFGAYSLSAVPATGQSFLGWTTSSGASVDFSSNPTATLTLTANSTLTAHFGATPPHVTLWLNDTSSSGSIQLETGGLYGPSTLVGTYASGASVVVVPGLYSVQADPPSGDNFSGFTSTGSGIEIAARALPFTWVLVSATVGSVGLTAHSTPSVALAELDVTISGRGAITLAGHLLRDTTGANVTTFWNVAVGSYPTAATPASGWSFLGWQDSGSLVQSNFANESNLTFEVGESYLIATFGAQVTVLVVNASSGRVSIGESGPLGNDSSVDLAPGGYRLDALPFTNESFVRWSVLNSSALWVRSVVQANARLSVNASGTLVVTFAALAGHAVTFAVSPVGAGTIRFNGLVTYGANGTGPTVNRSVANGSYLLTEYPGGQYRFVQYALTGNLSLVNGNLVVTGDGTVTAEFGAKSYPVTFVSSPAGAAGASIGGVSVVSGETLYFNDSRVPLVAQPSPNATFIRWSTSLTVASVTSAATNLTVNAPGTITELLLPFYVPAPTARYVRVDVGVPDPLAITLHGATGAHYAWGGLPLGCSSANLPAIPCTPRNVGNYTIRVFVSVGGGYAASSPALHLVVVAAPHGPNLTWTPPASETGTPTNFTFTFQGGVGLFTFLYGGFPAGCVPPDLPVMTCAASTAGTYPVSAKVVDVFGNSTETFANWTVALGPSVASFSATRPVVTAGALTTLEVSPAGGVGPYRYQFTGLPPGCTSVSTAALGCTPLVAGAYSVRVTVTDSLGGTGNSSLALTVNPPPVVHGFEVNPPGVLVGGSVTFNLTASGGTGGLTLSYANLPAGCGPTNATKFTCTPTRSATYLVTATVTDTQSVSGNSTVQLIVSAQQGVGPSQPSPGPASSNELLYFGIAAVVIVAVVLLVALVWGRKRAPPAAPAGPAAATPPWKEGPGA